MAKSTVDDGEDENPIYVPPLRASSQSFWEALGKFLHSFAFVEAGLFFLLEARTKVSPDVAKAVFSGVRVDAAMDLVRRISEAETGKRDDPDLEPAFQQLKLIANARNDLVHFGAMLGKGNDRIVTNSIKALTEKHVRSQPFSTASLDAMSNDAIKIYVHLAVARSKADGTKSEFDGSPALKDAWLYKPPRPETPPRKNQQGRKRPAKPK